MKVVIQPLDFNITDELETFITNALDVLRQFDIDITRIEVILGSEIADRDRQKFCNIRLISPGTGYLVAQRGEQFETAVQKAVDDLGGKINRDSRPG
jgi:ribosome-associated translation inhibitor RaiA